MQYRISGLISQRAVPSVTPQHVLDGLGGDPSGELHFGVMERVETALGSIKSTFG